MFIPALKKRALPLVVLGLLTGLYLLHPPTTGSIVWSGGTDGSGPTDRMIRLHVMANSDAPADQALKYEVRDRIVETMGPILAQAHDIQESRELTWQSLPAINILAQDIVEREGFDYKVSTQYGRFDFPTRLYGDLCVPAGNYEAVRVVIGEGEGANWWCVLFPPLCFVGTTAGATYISSDGTVSGDILMPTVAMPRNGIDDTKEVTPEVRLKIKEWLTR